MKTTILFVTLFLASTSQAEVKNYDLGNQKFSLNVPSDWKQVEDFMGAPLALFGPQQKDGPRAVMMLTPTGEVDKKGFFKHPPKDIVTYKTGREDWLKGVYGESLSYDKFKQEKWNGIESSAQLGYHYDIPQGKFYERSIYITCSGNKIFHIKSLVPSTIEKQYNSIVENTVKSLKCEPVAVKTAQR